MNNNLKMTRLLKKWYHLILILGILMLLVGISTIQAGGRKNQKARVENSIGGETNENGSGQGEKLTVWKIIKMTDWLFWPFVLITAAGIMLIIYRALVENREKTRSQTLLQGKIRANAIRGLVQMIRTSQSNRVSRLMYQLISTFDKTNRAEPIGDDINQFLAAERESFETFNRVNGFLSESAGALGLLGTVWGIFQTFHAGKLDGPTILQGMSISLVTTLVGLIISLMLNMGGTYVFTLFNGQLNLLANKAEELRQALLFLEKKSATEIHTVNDNFDDFQMNSAEYPPRKQPRNKYSREAAFAEI